MKNASSFFRFLQNMRREKKCTNRPSLAFCVSQNNEMVMMDCVLCFTQLPNDNGDDNETVTGTQETRPKGSVSQERNSTNQKG